MLNQFLPVGQLHKELEDYLESWNWILGILNPENTTTIYQDKKTLAKLHHALNIGKYSKVKFREKLLLCASDEKLSKFAKKNNIRYQSIKEIQSTEFRKKIAHFNWGANKETKNFVEVFGYPDYLVPLKSAKFETIQKLSKAEEPYKQLKDYQSEIYFKSQKFVELANSRLLIQLPTGAGKTRTTMEIIATFLNKGEGRQVVWLADRSELCEQAMEAFLNVWIHIGKSDIQIYRIWGDTKVPKKIQGKCFVVGMYQKIHRPLRDNKFSLKADLIITDEAHNVLAPTYEESIENLSDFQGKQTRIVGLTATPGRRSEFSAQNEQLVSFFNENILKIDVEGKGPIEYLQGKKVLARCIHEPLETEIKYTLTPNEWKKLAESFEHEYPEDFVKKIANDQRRNVIILKRLVELASERKHILVFGASIKQSKILCGILIALGHSAVYVDGNSPTNYRKDVVKKFKKGEIKFIFNYGVFTAGFDAPNIDAVVITRPTRSVVLYGQMIGRGMRGLEIGGTEEFLLVDVIDDIITEHGGLDNVYDYFSEYWESE